MPGQDPVERGAGGGGVGGQHRQEGGPREGRGELLPQGSSGAGGGGEGGQTGGYHTQARGEQGRPELRWELTNGRVEARQREGAIGGGCLENIGGQDWVPTGPGHLLSLVLHPPILEPDLDTHSQPPTLSTLSTRTPHLNRVLWQIQFVCELASLWSADVVLLDELLLQPGYLLPGEGRPVPPDVVQGRLLGSAVPSRTRGVCRGENI